MMLLYIYYTTHARGFEHIFYDFIIIINPSAIKVQVHLIIKQMTY